MKLVDLFDERDGWRVGLLLISKRRKVIGRRWQEASDELARPCLGSRNR